MAHRSHRKHLKHVHQHEVVEHAEEHEASPNGASYLQLGRDLLSSVKEAALAVPRAVVHRVLRRPRAMMERLSGMYSQHRATAK